MAVSNNKNSSTIIHINCPICNNRYDIDTVERGTIDDELLGVVNRDTRIFSYKESTIYNFKCNKCGSKLIYKDEQKRIGIVHSIRDKRIIDEMFVNNDVGKEQYLKEEEKHYEKKYLKY